MPLEDVAGQGGVRLKASGTDTAETDKVPPLANIDVVRTMSVSDVGLEILLTPSDESSTARLDAAFEFF